MYNLTEAFARLAELTKNGPTTREALLELAAQVLTETEGVSANTAQTVAYSGDMPNGGKSDATIKALQASGKPVRVIDGSPAAHLFLSDAFKDAVAKTFDPTWTKEYLAW